MTQSKIIQKAAMSLGLIVAVGGFWAVPSTHAGGKIEFGESKWVQVGAGARASVRSVGRAAPNGKDASKVIGLESVRLYVSGQVHPLWSMTFNTEMDAANDINVLDAIIQMGYNDYFNVWAGRFLPPSDRSNFSGPYYLGTWDFPIVQAYPAIFAGRDDGAAIWGQVNGGMFKYQVGAFKGQTNVQNQSGELLYAGRLTFNALDPEPGYYNSSTYYGAKDIAAIGIAGMSQKNFAKFGPSDGNFLGWNIDLLLEKKIADMGAATIEGAFYRYNLANSLFSSITQGEGYFALAGYIFPKCGPGQFKPHVRYQNFRPDVGRITESTEGGISYIMDGDNLRFTFVISETHTLSGGRATAAVLGMQVQI